MQENGKLILGGEAKIEEALNEDLRRIESLSADTAREAQQLGERTEAEWKRLRNHHIF